MFSMFSSSESLPKMAASSESLPKRATVPVSSRHGYHFRVSSHHGHPSKRVFPKVELSHSPAGIPWALEGIPSLTITTHPGLHFPGSLCLGTCHPFTPASNKEDYLGCTHTNRWILLACYIFVFSMFSVSLPSLAFVVWPWNVCLLYDCLLPALILACFWITPLDHLVYFYLLVLDHTCLTMSFH